MLRAPRGPSRASHSSGDNRLAKKVGHSLPRGGSVLSLGAMFGRADREHCSRQPRREPLQYATSLHLAQRRSCAEVKTELNPRVSGIDALPAGPRRARKLLEKLAVWYSQTARSARSWSHVQVRHESESNLTSGQGHRCGFDPRGLAQENVSQ